MKPSQIPETIRQHVREAAREGGSDEEDNLWLSCSLCNRYKGAQTSATDPLTGNVVQLYNPRHNNWYENFRWSVDGIRIEGLTDAGRATTGALKLNNELAVEVRRNWLRAGWHPPAEG